MRLTTWFMRAVLRHEGPPMAAPLPDDLEGVLPPGALPIVSRPDWRAVLAIEDAVGEITAAPTGTLGEMAIAPTANATSDLPSWIAVVPSGLLFGGLSFAMIIAMALKRDLRLVTPGGVAALLSDPQLLLKFAAIEADEGDEVLRALADGILQMSRQEYWPIHLEAAQRALRLFRPGTHLHKAGRGATLTHADLIQQGYLIFLVGPQAHINRLGSYYALHLLALTQALYGGAGPLRIIADEFTNAPLKPLVEALTTLRAFGAEVHMIAQSRSEIERRFGRLETQTIEENAIVKQWFGFSSFEEAERVSKAMGEELALSTSLGGDNEGLRLQTNLQTIRQRQMSPAELMAMPAEL